MMRIGRIVRTGIKIPTTGLVPGTDNAFRIPTPHEFGFIGNVALRSYAAVFDEDPIHRHLFAERMGALIKHELALDPTPQLIKPIKEIMTDRNAFTGRNIEGPALQRLSPTERKRLWTTQTAIGTSKLLNQVPWETVQLSPVQVEHLIKGYWLGGSTDVICYRRSRADGWRLS